MSKISIITPCFNAENYIAETIESVVTQKAVINGCVELEYIICDGGSTDRTVEIAETLLKDSPDACVYKIISESDNGMYDALAKGLRLVSGEVVAYINAGDLYHSGAFGVVAEIFASKLANWVTGYTVCYNDKSQVIETSLPYIYRRCLFECGYYDNQLPSVQQESTFWAAHLNQEIDLDCLASFKYAGDYYLWLQFSKIEELKIVRSHLGGFKYHGGQLSRETIDNVTAYQLEQLGMARQASISEKVQALIDRVLWSAPYKLKKRLASDTFISYRRALNAWQLESKRS